MKKKESESYLNDQLITYLGNKRTLLDLIQQGIEHICEQLGKDQLVTLDMFSGSGIVSRFLKAYSSHLIANDLEDYAYTINQCYLSNKEDLDWDLLESWQKDILQKITHEIPIPGFFTKLYAPANDEAIQPGERVFYTRRNALYLDMARSNISKMPLELQPFLLGPLLSEASIHTNTAGVFKGFYKNNDGIGQFGGSGQNALTRIRGDIHLQLPVLSEYSCQTSIYQKDANDLARELPPLDLAYLDPPYNQHPYGSNYFMLNLLANYKEPQDISEVSGIPADWKRSAYNKKSQAILAMQDLCQTLSSRFILISFNSEGFISKQEMEGMLGKFGKVKTLEQEYPAFRGSRNLGDRPLAVQEYLFILEKEKTGPNKG